MSLVDARVDLRFQAGQSREDDAVAHDVIVRRDPDQRFISDSISKHVEVLAQTAVDAKGVPVPKIIYEFEKADGLGQGYLMYCEAGEAPPSRLLRDPEYSEARAGQTELEPHFHNP